MSDTKGFKNKIKMHYTFKYRWCFQFSDVERKRKISFFYLSAISKKKKSLILNVFYFALNLVIHFEIYKKEKIYCEVFVL